MTNESPDDGLSEREQLLLRVLVGSYIRDGQPVGSRSLSRESGLALSSATIRNIVADLEALGFVSSPHTSAGRIPTDKGYRFFVDSLLKARSPTEEDPAFGDLRRQLDAARDDSKALVAAASQLLSNVTRLAGVVTLPRAQQASITQIEFVGLSDNRALVILVFNDREVQNRIIQLERYHNPDELRRAANLLTERCRGKTLGQVRADILREMQEARESMNSMMKDAISVAEHVFKPEESNRMEYVIAGETNLMGAGELSSVDKLRRLFEAFNEKRDILNLLDHSLRADGVQIFIGQESGYRILDDVSMVTAPYSADNEVVGVIGVIGPTRMAYERVIPIVDLTAKILGARSPQCRQRFCPRLSKSLIQLRSLMPDSNMAAPGADEKTEVLPETAVQLVELERLKIELAASEERAKNHWEQYLRALADVDNLRKRGAKDLENTRLYAVEKFAQELIGVKDSLELAIANAGKADVASLIEGQSATLRLLAKAFEKAQIEEVNPEGLAFNPELHEAMLAQPSDAPPNTVLAVIQRGYQLNGRLLRPARVVVAASKN